KREAAQVAGPQRLNDRIAIDDFRPRHVHDPGAGLHERQSLTIEKVHRRYIERKLRDDDVAVREEPLQRPIRNLEAVLIRLGQPRSLKVENGYSERVGAGRDLAADLAKADDPDRDAV